MSFSQTTTTNPLHIRKIPRGAVDLTVNRDNRGVARSFVVDAVRLDRLKLPEGARVRLFVYSKSREQRVDLGTVDHLRLGVPHDFEIDTGGVFHFRLIVCAADTPSILASCEGLRATDDSDQAGRQHLLAVDVSNELGERLWDVVLEGDAEPVLRVTDDPDIGMLARLRGDPLFRALIVPQAVEEILYHLTQNRDDDSESWQSKWNSYLKHRGLDLPDEDADPESCRSWAREEAQRFATEHKFLTKSRIFLAEKSNDA